MNIPKLDAKKPIFAPKTLKFLQRVRIKEKSSESIILDNSEWIRFYAGATGRIIRFNIEDGTLVVVLDTGTTLNDRDRIMECFNESDLEPLAE